jgi:hypothetical protein
MLSKILLTLLVVIAAIAVLRFRMRREREQQQLPDLRTIDVTPAPPRSRLFPILAGGLLVLVLVGAGYYLYIQVWDGYREVSVRVINANSGEVVHYRAYKGDVDMEQGVFRTLDGRTVTLAAVERLEMGGE